MKKVGSYFRNIFLVYGLKKDIYMKKITLATLIKLLRLNYKNISRIDLSTPFKGNSSISKINFEFNKSLKIPSELLKN